MPTLQYLADMLYEDNDIEYVYNESQRMASKEKIQVTGEYIYTKLDEYPYEFQIDTDLKLASIDGIKIADSNSQKVENLENEMTTIKENYESMKNDYESLKNDFDNLKKSINESTNNNNGFGYIDTSNLITTFAITSTQSYTASENCYITANFACYNSCNVGVYVNDVWINKFWNHTGNWINCPYSIYLAKGDTIKFVVSNSSVNDSSASVWKIKQ